MEEFKEYKPKQRGKAWVCDDIPNKEYHKGVGVSSSFIRKFGESQLHALEHQQETTPAMRFGTAAHSLLVEGQEAFDKEVVVITGSPYTKANKELKEEYEKRGLTVLKEADVESIHNMKDAMVYEGNSYLNARGKVAESSFYWYEDAILCKCRPDLICPPLDDTDSKDKIVIVDYKTTQSVEPYAFANSVKKFRYDLQASCYRS